MIKNVIFDFGDVFVNLDKPATFDVLFKLGVEEITEEMMEISYLYEMGKITTEEFVSKFTEKYPNISAQQFMDAWNAILKDFPLHRLDFLKELAASKKYRLFLLSNTNDLHISWIQNDWGLPLYEEFKSCFEQFYLSHEIHFRKPNADIFEFVLQENGLQANETFFIDDTTANTDMAASLGIHVWNNNPETEDVVDLLSRKEFRS
jgi:putative hydrolase of the HAD superfamily